MSNLASEVEGAAKKVVEAIGSGIRNAVHGVLHETADGLEGSARSHLEHDANAAHEFERTGSRMSPGNVETRPESAPHTTAESPGGESPTVPETHTGGESGTKTPDTPGPDTNLIADLPGATDLPNPGQKLSKNDYPYLQSPTQVRETEAIAGEIPKTRRHVVPADDGRLPPDASIRKTFRGNIKPFTFEKGKTYYRAVGDGAYPTGGFWSETPPVTSAQLRGDLAVLNDWNGNHGVVSFTPNEDIHAGWEGRVAPQGASTGVHGVQDPDNYLPGTGRQIWIPRDTVGPHNGTWKIAPTSQGETS